MNFNFEILNNPQEKEKLAIEMFNVEGDKWQYYESFINRYGLETLLKIYDGKTLKKIIKDSKSYTVVGAMLERNVDRVLEYALSDNDFLDVLSKNGIGIHISSLLSDIDYALIKKCLEKRKDIVIDLFTLNSLDCDRLLRDSDISDDIKCQIINKSYDVDVLSNYFNNKESLKVFNMLSDRSIRNLIMSKVSFCKEITMSNHMFEVCKTDSLINFRKRINNITLNSGNIDIEIKVYYYYIDLLKDYNPVTELFHQYERLNEIKMKYYEKEDYIVNGDVLYRRNNEEELKRITSKKISEIVVDYLFKDNIYNVFINIRELLSYNNGLNNKLLNEEIVNFYQLILNIDKISNDEKIDLFYRLKDKKIDEMFYDDLNKLKRDSYQKITSSLIQIKDDEKDNELSQKYEVPVYDYRDKEFYMIVRTMGREFDEYTNRRRNCYSLISNNHTIVFNPNNYIYGYGNVKEEDILHVYEHDAYSSNINNNETTNYINRIYTPEELINNSISINEIQLLNKKDGKRYSALKPTYIIALNEITEKVVLESKRLNIPIILINSKELKHDIEYEGDIRIKTEPFQSFTSIDNYTDKEIDYSEEKRRSNKR